MTGPVNHSARPEDLWPRTCASRGWGPRRHPGSRRGGRPGGRSSQAGRAEPNLQKKEDVRPANSSPAPTGCSVYFYIPTSRFFSCSQEKLMELHGA